MIEISRLEKHFGKVPALRGLDLTIGAGMFGLLGPNGAGKTTLLRILAGLLRPGRGRVTVLGHDVAGAPGKAAVTARLGYLPQELGWYPDLTGREFVDYIAILKGHADASARRREVQVLLELVGLGETADRRLKTYSGGMKRRIGIAQALLGDPKLLIVDEPTAGLDPEERVRLRNLLAEMAARCTVILSTHIIEDVSQSCSDLAVINQGQIRFHGHPRTLMAQARGYTWRLTLPPGMRPASDLMVVSTLVQPDCVQYRVLGTPHEGARVEPVEPSLEDGYLWLMQSGRLGLSG